MSNNKYLREIDAFKVPNTNKVDVYSVLGAFDVKSHAIGQAIKKLLCAGIRGKGDELQDLKEAVQAIERRIADVETQNESVEELYGVSKEILKSTGNICEQVASHYEVSRDLVAEELTGEVKNLKKENSRTFDGYEITDVRTEEISIGSDNHGGPIKLNDEIKRIIVKKDLNAIDSYLFIEDKMSGRKNSDRICQTSEDGAVNEFIISHPELSNIIWYSRDWGDFNLVSTREGYNVWVQEYSTKPAYLYNLFYLNVTREKAKKMFEEDWADRQENLKQK